MTDDVRSSLERLAERGVARGADAVFNDARQAASQVGTAQSAGRVGMQPSRRLVMVACAAAVVLVVAGLALGFRRDDGDALDPASSALTLTCVVNVGAETGSTSFPLTSGSTAELTVAGYLTKFKVNIVPGARPPASLAAVIEDPSGKRLMSTLGGVNPDFADGPSGDITEFAYHFQCGAGSDPDVTGSSVPINVSDCPPGPRDTIPLSPGAAGNLGLRDFVYSRSNPTEPPDVARQFLRDAVFGPGCDIDNPSVLEIGPGENGHLVAIARPPITIHDLSLVITYETTPDATGITKITSGDQGFTVEDNGDKPVLSWTAAPSDAAMASVRFRTGLNTWETNTSPTTERLPLDVPGTTIQTWPTDPIDWVLITFFDNSGNIVGLLGGAT